MNWLRIDENRWNFHIISRFFLFFWQRNFGKFGTVNIMACFLKLNKCAVYSAFFVFFHIKYTEIIKRLNTECTDLWPNLVFHVDKWVIQKFIIDEHKRYPNCVASLTNQSFDKPRFAFCLQNLWISKQIF
jgi:hypothetical protein